MNKTKKITQGAMLLAILGALIIIDRITSFFFTEFVVLIAPVIIIMYSAMYDVKQGALLSVGILIITFLIANINYVYLIYIPVGILTGIAYSIGLKKNFDNRKLITISIITYVFGEIVATFVIYPLLGVDIASMIATSNEMLGEFSNAYGVKPEQILSALKVDFNNLLIVIYVVTTLLVGIMEGVIIHFISVFLLRRFKIRNIEKKTLMDFKPHPVISYICMAGLIALVLNKYINNQIFYYVALISGILGGAVLLYFGYIFLILYGVIVLHKKKFGIVVFLLGFIVPMIYFVMMILGFLYGSGPLRTYLDNLIKIQTKQ